MNTANDNQINMDSEFLHELCLRAGRNLKKLREEKEFSSQELADSVGLDKRILDRLEAGEHIILSEKLKVLTDFFEVDYGEFFKLEDE